MCLSDKIENWLFLPADFNQNSVSKVIFSVENDAITFIFLRKSVQAVENP